MKLLLRLLMVVVVVVVSVILIMIGASTGCSRGGGFWLAMGVMGRAVVVRANGGWTEKR